MRSGIDTYPQGNISLRYSNIKCIENKSVKLSDQTCRVHQLCDKINILIDLFPAVLSFILACCQTALSIWTQEISVDLPESDGSF